MTAKEQFKINKKIEALLTQKGDEFTTYNIEDKNLLRLYGGYGGLENQGAVGQGLLYEYYTPVEVVKVMWQLLLQYGFDGGLVLEPSSGIGRFIEYAPLTKREIHFVGYEISPIAAKIASILHPLAHIKRQYFEQEFLKNRSSIKEKVTGVFDACIGNPPYGRIDQKQGGMYMEMGERNFTKATSYDSYFIFRGLDKLRSGGLLCYIIGTATGSPLLSKKKSATSQAIAERGKLIDAYRLPDGTFKRTDVVADIIVIEKR